MRVQINNHRLQIREVVSSAPRKEISLVTLLLEKKKKRLPQELILKCLNI